MQKFRNIIDGLDRLDITPKFKEKYDNVFLPNIFHFPYVRTYELKNNGHAGTHLLAGIRIMQLVGAVYSYNSKTKNRVVTYCEELAKMISEIFHYDVNIISNIILLFSEYEIVSLNGSPITTNEIGHHVFAPMPKIKYIFNNFIGDVAYLNMCAMRVPINNKYTFKIPLLFACCFEDVGLDEWMAKEIMNACNLFRIISTVNQVELKGVDETLKAINNPEYQALIKYAKENFDLFTFPDKKVREETLRAHVIGEIEGIFNKINDLATIENLVNITWNIQDIKKQST